MSTTEKPEVRYPDVHVQITGKDGNIFNIIGLVTGALRRAPGTPPGEVEKFTSEVMDCDSYDAALRVVMSWVDVS